MCVTNNQHYRTPPSSEQSERKREREKEYGSMTYFSSQQQSQSTDNDAALARALQEREDAEAAAAAPRHPNRTVIVPGRAIHSSFQQQPAVVSNFPNSSTSSRMISQPQVFPPPTRSAMCVVPCVFGNGICVEMMIDTGAQNSVMSAPLARKLQLDTKIDTRFQGIASGVGQARILGKIFNVIVELGHVEFGMDWIVLEVPDQLLLLGLDLMRRYKCIVDMESNVLIFGGRGGVEVPMLPAEEQHHHSMRNTLGCPMM